MILVEMLTSCAVSLPSCAYPFLFPTDLFFHPRRRVWRLSFLSFAKCSCESCNSFALNSSSLCLISHCRVIQSDDHHFPKSSKSSPTHRQRSFHQFLQYIEYNSAANGNPEIRNQEVGRGEEQSGVKAPIKRGLFTNMWWVDIKAALGQRLNVGAIVSSAVVVAKERHLALPHVVVPDIRYIDWSELQRRGFKGVVFDKDNTITAPYCLTLWGPLNSSIERCKSVFSHDIAVFSNSAGLQEYDNDGSKAMALENAIGIKVIRHRTKKPVGTAEEIEKHFNCPSSQLIMVGDRPLTDIVFGNRNGFLTILTEPLSLEGEPFIVRQVRKLEMTLVNFWFRKGLRPVRHNLLPDSTKCVKDPQSF